LGSVVNVLIYSLWTLGTIGRLMTDLLKSIIDWAIELLRADAGEIYLWNPAREELSLTFGSGWIEMYAGITLKIGEGMAGRIVKTGQPMIIDDYIKWEGRSEIFKDHPPLVSVLGVPMFGRENMIGVLEIDVDARKHHFDQNDIRSAMIFANVAALAIENEKLYGELQEQSNNLQHTLELEVAQRTAELVHRALQLETTAKVSREITSILDIDRLLSRVIDLIKTTFGYYYINIYLIDTQSSQLVLQATSDRRGAHGNGQGKSFVIDANSILGKAALTNQAILLNDLRKPGSQKNKFSKTRSELVIPLGISERVLGILDIQSAKANTFSQDDVILYQSLGDQIGIAIENAHLYNQSRILAAHEERDRLARDLHDAVTQTLFSASLIADVLPGIWKDDPEKGLRLLADVRQLTRGALAEMRTLLMELRPEALIEAHLCDILNQYAEAFTGRTGIPVEALVEGDLVLPPDVKVGLYRIVQESLNNIFKHACATNVKIHLHSFSKITDRVENQASEVELIISDNGCGFNPAKVSFDHFGLKFMIERAEAIGAKLKIDSQIGSGTSISVVLENAGG
jgi:signal transduction histidine kinase